MAQVKAKNSLAQWLRPLSLLPFIALIGVFGVMSAVFTVEAQEEAMVLRFGAHVRTLGPGLHYKLPFGLEEVYKIPVGTVDVEEFGYRSLDRRAKQRLEARGFAPGKTVRGDYVTESVMLTGDLNIVMVGWDVQYRRASPEKFLFHVQEPSLTLRDISQSVMRQVIGDRASIQVLTVERGEIQAEAKARIQEAIEGFDMGIQVVEVNLLFVDPPEKVIDSFHDLNKAEQDAQRFYEAASREYEQEVNKARGTAERVLHEAEGYARGRENIARGEADRFLSILAKYRVAPEITRRRLYLETYEDLLPKVDRVIVIDPSGGVNPLPILGLDPRSAPAAGAK